VVGDPVANAERDVVPHPFNAIDTPGEARGPQHPDRVGNGCPYQHDNERYDDTCAHEFAPATESPLPLSARRAADLRLEIWILR
jgi:hypothetical protein